MTRPISQPHVDIGGGHTLHVRDWGGGPTVLLMAGWAMDSRIWGETMTMLNDAGLRTVAYDRRGHGRSSDPGVVDYDLLADDLAAVIDQLDLRDVTIVAHSGAGGEAIRYLTRHGARRVAALVLVGATGPMMRQAEDNPAGVPGEMIDVMIDQLATNLVDWLDQNAEPFAPGSPKRSVDWLGGMVLDTSRRMLVDLQRVIANADQRQEAAALRLPVAIIHGDLDASAPVDLTARRYAELIPGARLSIYAGVAHGVMITHARRLSDEIAAFVREGDV